MEAGCPRHASAVRGSQGSSTTVQAKAVHHLLFKQPGAARLPAAQRLAGCPGLSPAAPWAGSTVTSWQVVRSPAGRDEAKLQAHARLVRRLPRQHLAGIKFQLADASGPHNASALRGWVGGWVGM